MQTPLKTFVVLSAREHHPRMALSISIQGRGSRARQRLWDFDWSGIDVPVGSDAE